MTCRADSGREPAAPRPIDTLVEVAALPPGPAFQAPCAYPERCILAGRCLMGGTLDPPW